MTDSPLPFPTVYTVSGPDGVLTFEDLDEAKEHALALYEEIVRDVQAWFEDLKAQLGLWPGDPTSGESSLSLVPPWNSDTEDGISIVASPLRIAGVSDEEQ